MKKIFGLVAVAAIALFAVSCGSGNGPGAVVEKAYNDVINGDYKAFVEACYFADSIQGPELEQAKSMAVSVMEKTMKNAKEEDKAKSVKVVNEEVNDAEATVDVEVTKGSGDVEKNTLKLKKDKDGNWKISDQGNLQSSQASGDGLDLGGLEEAADSLGNAVDEAAEEVKDATEDGSDE